MKEGRLHPKRGRRVPVAALLLAVAVGGSLLFSCARQADSPAGEVRAAHAAADVAEGPDQARAAAAGLERAADGLDGATRTGREVRWDLTSRAARLHLSLGEAEHARQLLRAEVEGLGDAPPPNPLLAQLHLDLADAEAALGNAPAEQAALLSALSIHSQLFDQEIADP